LTPHWRTVTAIASNWLDKPSVILANPFDFHQDPAAQSPLACRAGIDIEEVFPYQYFWTCTEESLRNLAGFSIDLQQLHVWNPEWLHREEWRGD